MSQDIAKNLYTFRQKFKLVSKELIQWFPGHMNVGMQQMQRKINQVDCILEVHDARIPLSGRNINFHKKVIGPKPHILVFTKKDLIESKYFGAIRDRLHSDGVNNVIFTNCKDQSCRGLKQVTAMASDLIRGSERYNRSENLDLRLMVIGVPNVGKSSLINALRNKNLHRGRAAAVGAVAGITKSVQSHIRVNSNPPIYLIDTPGILPPNIPDVETGMRLALCSCLKDENVGIESIADYLLFWLNRNKVYSYVDKFKLNEPIDNIIAVLSHIASNDNRMKMIKVENGMKNVPDFKYAAKMFVNSFRTCELGSMIVDMDKL